MGSFLCGLAAGAMEYLVILWHGRTWSEQGEPRFSEVPLSMLSRSRVSSSAIRYSAQVVKTVFQAPRFLAPPRA